MSSSYHHNNQRSGRGHRGGGGGGSSFRGHGHHRGAWQQGSSAGPASGQWHNESHPDDGEDGRRHQRPPPDTSHDVPNLDEWLEVERHSQGQDSSGNTWQGNNDGSRYGGFDRGSHHGQQEPSNSVPSGHVQTQSAPGSSGNHGRLPWEQHQQMGGITRVQGHQTGDGFMQKPFMDPRDVGGPPGLGGDPRQHRAQLPNQQPVNQHFSHTSESGFPFGGNDPHHQPGHISQMPEQLEMQHGHLSAPGSSMPNPQPKLQQQQQHSSFQLKPYQRKSFPTRTPPSVQAAAPGTNNQPPQLPQDFHHQQSHNQVNSQLPINVFAGPPSYMPPTHTQHVDSGIQQSQPGMMNASQQVVNTQEGLDREWIAQFVSRVQRRMPSHLGDKQGVLTVSMQSPLQCLSLKPVAQ